MGPQQPLRIVFDTNIVISALVFGSGLAWLRGAWSRRAIMPIICQETVVELIRVLNYTKFKLMPGQREDLLRDYLPYAEIFTLPTTLPHLPIPCRDPQDEIFIHLTQTSRADFLITGDRDLLDMATLAPVRIIEIATLKSIIDNPPT